MIRLNIPEAEKTRFTNSVLSWVKRAVDAGNPVFAQVGDLQELVPSLKGITSPLNMFLGLTDAEIKDLVRVTEAAAQLDRALRERTANADASARIQNLQAAYQELWQKFAADKQILSLKYGLTEQAMLTIFTGLARIN